MGRERDRHEPWRVGVLFSRTGVTAVIEETQLRGTLLAIEEINASGGINGRELVPIIYDPGSDERNFARLADHLLTAMNQTESDAAILIAGGFHSDAVAEQLRKKGYLVLTYTPAASGAKSWPLLKPPAISTSGPARPFSAASVAPTLVPFESST